MEYKAKSPRTGSWVYSHKDRKWFYTARPERYVGLEHQFRLFSLPPQLCSARTNSTECIAAWTGC